jgi:hypothetical protein
MLTVETLRARLGLRPHPVEDAYFIETSKEYVGICDIEPRRG